MDFDSEEYTTDSESNESNPDWRQRERHSARRGNDTADGSSNREVRRSPRLAAQATPQTARRTSQRQAASRRTFL